MPKSLDEKNLIPDSWEELWYVIFEKNSGYLRARDESLAKLLKQIKNKKQAEKPPAKNPENESKAA